MTVGRFLEISVHAPDVGASVLFYEALGFRQLDTGETWNHAYAVLSDGRLHIGLHGYEFASPSITFVHPDLSASVEDFLAHGIELEFSKLGDDEFNELGFYAPLKQMVTLLEARTFSPPGFDDRDFTACGKFLAMAVPVADLDWAGAFWERLGFDETLARNEDSVTLQGDGIAVACSLQTALRGPGLLFTADRLSDTAEAMRHLGLQPQEYATVPGGKGLLLRSPEGLDLLVIRRP